MVFTNCCSHGRHTEKLLLGHPGQLHNDKNDQLECFKTIAGVQTYAIFLLPSYVFIVVMSTMSKSNLERINLVYHEGKSGHELKAGNGKQELKQTVEDACLLACSL